MAHLRQQTTLHEFFRWESQSWVGVVADVTTDEKVYFMPVKNVQTYFMANDSRKLNKILTEVFKSDYPPIDSELILRDHTAIFCILLRLGQGKQIEHFARYEELSDRRLPFDSSHPPPEFPSVHEDNTFLQRFCDKQKMYCVPVLDSHMIHKHFGQRLLPITSHELYGSQSMGSQHVVTIYGPHNKLLPSGADTQNPYNNTFILRRYAKENEAHYKQEVDGFRGVRHAESIIKFYGSFIHGDEFNTLLEFADKGSLEDYFKRETPPSRGVDIIKFWEALFLLIKGLKAIHSVRLGHHDVKPESILVVSNGSDAPSQWNFKFANVGVSHSKADALQDRTETSKGTDNCPTYAPPESYSPNHDDRVEKRSSKVNWSADIWSLGAIFSEAAMWIADGYKGLQDYRRQRMAETDRILFKGGDCFHDGEKVLQSVLDAHADIEDRLRRSDYITKDVLDSMVDEMLWDEDRPNAKALWRKAEMVSSRARQRLSANSGDEFSRSGSAQSRALSMPRAAAPTTPLPPLPRGAQGLSSIAERQYPPNVEKWRSQIGELQLGTASQAGGPVSDIASPTFPSQQTIRSESVSDFDRDVTGSVVSWNPGDGASSIASPLTQYSSPHASVQYDFSRHNSNEGPLRVMRNQPSYEYRPQPRKPVSHMSYTNASDMSDSASIAPPSISDHPAHAHQDRMPPLPSQGGWTTGSVISERSEPQPTQRQEAKLPSRAPSRAASHSSGVSSQPSEPARPKSAKRNGGFSLFPTKTWNNNSTITNIRRSIEKASSHHSDENIPRSMMASSSTSGSLPSPPAFPDQFEYLSLNTCYEWKMAQKKTKKSSKVPPLPGAAMLEDLNNRDHVFIIDDSASMASVWPDVKRVFETLSYVVKGMGPDGTELFFTVAYDTWRRKDTHDLVMYLDKKACRGVTNISHRLDLQLQTYRVRLYNEKKAIGIPVKKGKEVPPVRPMSFYILTNGEWGPGPDVKVAIQTTVDFMQKEGFPPGQVTVEFISFAQTAGAMQKINELAQKDFGMDIVDCTRWTGNVLKMLKGPLDKGLFDENPPESSELPIQMTNSRAESSHTLVYARDVINELA